MTNLIKLGLHQVKPDPTQVRKSFDKEDLDRLEQAIAAVGQLEPVLVRADEQTQGYVLVAGERRWRALNSLLEKTSEARFSTIDALVVSGCEDEAHRIAVQVAENVSSSLSPFELVAAVRRLRTGPEGEGRSIAELQNMLGLTRQRASDLVRLAGAPAWLVELGRKQEDRPALSVSHLVVLAHAYRVLNQHDRAMSRSSKATTTPIAEKMVRRLGVAAAGRGYSTDKLKLEVKRIVDKAKGTRGPTREREAKERQRQRQRIRVLKETIRAAEAGLLTDESQFEALRGLGAKLARALGVSDEVEMLELQIESLRDQVQRERETIRRLTKRILQPAQRSLNARTEDEEITVESMSADASAPGTSPLPAFSRASWDESQ